jgi:hypothetical protein
VFVAMAKDDSLYRREEIVKYPCIYNHKLSEYSKKYSTDSAWEKVAKEIKI